MGKEKVDFLPLFKKKLQEDPYSWKKSFTLLYKIIDF